jgi:glucose/arabinose dehydrogenase
VALAATLALAGGCTPGPRVIPAKQQKLIERTSVEYPAGMALTTYAAGLTAPSSIAFETDDPAYKGSIVIAESGQGDSDPKIYGFKPDGSMFWIYPQGNTLPFIGQAFRIYAPLGGITLSKGKIYASHRDENGTGVITAFEYSGKHTTVVADLPARGDYGLTDVAIHPNNGRLYFGVGAATNSGVVGLDNWDVGWVDLFPSFHDQALVNLKLNGYRFTTSNPRGGLFGGDDVAVTAPFQAFGASRQLRIPASTVSKPTSAIYSVNVEGGDLKVEAHGIRLPRGLLFNEYGNLFASNDGMELRGTRPVQDDPDSVLRILLGGQVWYGWPDYSADLRPIGELPRPPEEMIIRTGYPELAAVLDHEGSGLIPPDRNALLRAVFPPLSGAAKMALVNETTNEVFRKYRGSILVALSGDRAPFATSGRPLKSPQGYKVMLVDTDTKQASDFIFNTSRVPSSKSRDSISMERPIDVKFGPDGALYILDFGEMEMKDGRPKIKSRTGRIFRLAPLPGAAPAETTKPITP